MITINDSIDQMEKRVFSTFLDSVYCICKKGLLFVDMKGNEGCYSPFGRFPCPDDQGVQELDGYSFILILQHVKTFDFIREVCTVTIFQSILFSLLLKSC